MSEEIRINRAPAQPQANYAPAAAQAPAAAPASKMPWIVLAAVVVILALVGVLFRDKLFGMNTSAASKVSYLSKEYQAVFLTNGQVYFGKIQNVDKDMIHMKEIYYLQVIQPPLQGSGQDAQAQQQPAAQQQPQISLVKLGNELHGPEDEMFINRSQVLFFEDLKDDGQVVQAIKSYKANPAGQTPVQNQGQ